MGQYHELAPITREEYLALFRDAADDRAGEALLRLAWHEPEPTWAEQECAAALTDPRLQVRRAAVRSSGHLARRQKKLGGATIRRLVALRTDADLEGYVEDALDDLAIFGRPSAQ